MLQDIEKGGLRRFLMTDFDEDKPVQFRLSCMVKFFVMKALRRRSIRCCVTLVFQVNSNDQNSLVSIVIPCTYQAVIGGTLCTIIRCVKRGNNPQAFIILQLKELRISEQ